MVASSTFMRRWCSSDLGCRVNDAGDRGEQQDHVGVLTEGEGRRWRRKFGAADILLDGVAPVASSDAPLAVAFRLPLLGLR
jgi:hypothetical protein